MRNVIKSEGGYKAVIAYDPEIEMFRGEFVGLNGGADFYAKDAEGLKQEVKVSLDVFLRMCEEDGVLPKKKRMASLPFDLTRKHIMMPVLLAASDGLSLNQWIAQAVREAVRG